MIYCCCTGGCKLIDILNGAENSGWPGLKISITGSIIRYGTYDGVPNGFWQGRWQTGNDPSSVSLTFDGKKPKKIIVLSSAMERGESHIYSVVGYAESVILDLARPSSAYRQGEYNQYSDEIFRADGQRGTNSRFRLTITEDTTDSLLGFVWAHKTTNNANGIVNAIFLCDSLNSSATFVS
jgi:hypothetical protein